MRKRDRYSEKQLAKGENTKMNTQVVRKRKQEESEKVCVRERETKRSLF